MSNADLEEAVDAAVAVAQARRAIGWVAAIVDVAAADVSLAVALDPQIFSLCNEGNKRGIASLVAHYASLLAAGIFVNSVESFGDQWTAGRTRDTGDLSGADCNEIHDAVVAFVSARRALPWFETVVSYTAYDPTVAVLLDPSYVGIVNQGALFESWGTVEQNQLDANGVPR